MKTILSNILSNVQRKISFSAAVKAAAFAQLKHEKVVQNIVLIRRSPKM